jgi:ABC-type uncharacterized transport system ATPase subunit
VFVAQGLAQAAGLLLLDEPITGLDLPSTDRIRSAIEEERRRGVNGLPGSSPACRPTARAAAEVTIR